MVNAQPWIRPVEQDAQNSLGFWDINGSSLSARLPDLMIVNKKQGTGGIMNLPSEQTKE